MKMSAFFAFTFLLTCFIPTSSFAARQQKQFSVDPAAWQKGPSDSWHINMNTALKAAAETNRKILVLRSGSDWCGPCKRLYQNVLKTPQFEEFAKENLVLVYLDFPRRMPQDQKLYNEFIASAMKLNASGVPTTFILEPNGSIIGKFSGSLNFERYTAKISEFLKTSAQADLKLVKLSPQELAPHLQKMHQEKLRQKQAAAAETDKIKDEIKFQVIAWGLDRKNVNKPFSPERTINVPLNKMVYLKVRYTMPEGSPNAFFFLSAIGPRSFLPGHLTRSASGEFIGGMRSNSPINVKELRFSGKLQMPESNYFKLESLPCNVSWK